MTLNHARQLFLESVAELFLRVLAIVLVEPVEGKHVAAAVG